jgi:hypothetical protein
MLKHANTKKLILCHSDINISHMKLPVPNKLILNQCHIHIEYGITRNAQSR